MRENGEFPEAVEDRLVESEFMDDDGDIRGACSAENVTGGGASKVFTCVFQAVGESVEISRDEPSPFGGGDSGMAVCKESFGLLGGGGLVDGITDNMAPATCFRNSDMCGEGARCRAGMEVV